MGYISVLFIRRLFHFCIWKNLAIDVIPFAAEDFTEIQLTDTMNAQTQNIYLKNTPTANCHGLASTHDTPRNVMCNAAS